MEQAEEDLKWTDLLAREEAHHLACFLAQQVAEKALTGFLYARGEELVVGHSVDALCHRAATLDPAFAAGRSRWAILDAYYVPTRYPNGLPDSIAARVYNRKAAAEEAAALAAEVVATVAALLRGGAPPAARSGGDADEAAGDGGAPGAATGGGRGR